MEIKKGAGRKLKYTLEEITKALEDNDGYSVRASRQLGCSYPTLQNYLNRFPELKKTRKWCQSLLVEKCEDIVDLNADIILKDLKNKRILMDKLEEQGNYRELLKITFDKSAADFALKVLSKLDPEKWSDNFKIREKQEVEKVRDYSSLSDEQIKEKLHKRLNELKVIRAG